MYERKINEGRLLVLIYSTVIVPIYFILFFWYIRLDLSVIGDWQILVMIFVNPVTYIIVWELWMLLFGNRIANAYQRMKNVISFISVRYNLYYGLTALFFLFAIVFPLATPVVSMLVFGSLMWRLVSSKRDWDEHEKTPAWMVIIVAIAMIVPIGCNIFFYVGFFPQAGLFWDYYIAEFVPILREIARAMGTAFTLGSIIYLALYGTSEYELVFKKGERPREIVYVRVLQGGLFILFLLLIYIEKEGDNPIFRIIQYTAIFLNIVIIFGNSFKSRSLQGANKSIMSYILMILFFTFGVLDEPGLESLILLISSIAYMITFGLMLIRAEDG